ncbi:NAD(P)/FAD-dependent oxidoreductase [Nocardioides sp. TRM66260-LWL]|uniref:NAD(P)/FAD-dependent oxidoreductase n=1 Tax=Nocardioides oceani TaxID=3058369 RepID=A0ABT8FKM6_9ACTN|nr:MULTISPECIES: NAD(P)/FAD-dependent oxidoreductase [Nocardioides]MBZ5733572.1 NAD(P)/FAD-dependent oxidoreductase [Nocardioides sp. TRM66260-LWL]MDN4175231.1 NAD(P)/FAD-dependent oxidoreductase [Nocardioides oceani]WKN46661.1 NAD(P)/FAD-dependent oxidoreductase [Nocardioides sp. Arc9.136]
MSQSYDLIVLGAGMAGVASANKCASQGWRVAIVDPLPYGGTCALRGCDPKKILRRGAEIIDSARLMEGKGIDAGGLSIKWGDLMKHKHGFTDPVPENMEAGLNGNGVETLHGPARFTAERQIDVDGTRYDADRFLIATGARPRPLDFPGHEHLIDSTGFLDLDDLPSRILFVGGGFISFEFAHIAARAGASPVIVDRGERPLKGFDPDLVELLVARGAEIGVELRRSTSIVAVEPNSRGYIVTLDRAGVCESIETDLVVHGAGRVADLAGLALDAAGVEWGERGVSVSDHLQSTTNAAVWAAGDSADTAGMPLTPVAVIEAKVASSNMIKGTTAAPNYSGIPTAVFTIPELARVGMLETEAREQGIDLTVRHSDTSGWYSNYRLGETTAAAKVLIDRSTDRVVGAHLLGPEYGELINTFGLAITLGLTTRQLKSTTAAYPTVGSDLGSMV